MGQDYLHGEGQRVTTGNTQDPSQSAKAMLGIALSVVREGTPSRISSLLRDMEMKGEITSGIVSDADDDVFAESDLDDVQTDCDLDFADEDALKTDDTRGEPQTIVSGDGDWEKADSAFDPSEKFEICFDESGGKVSCRIKKDPRCGFFGNSPTATSILDELASRYEVLERMGEWIVTNRGAFARTGDLWDFVEEAYDESEKRQASVLQKDFITIVGLGCGRESFSRFIKHAVLCFGKKGRLPVRRLFQKEAKCAWVARAFRDKCRKAELDDMEAAIKSLPVTGLCKITGVSGEKVIELFGNKIKEV